MSTTRRGRAPLRAASIGLVVFGGTLGAAAREGLVLAGRHTDGALFVVPLANVIGAFILGYLFEALTRTAPAPERTRRSMLLVGTGFCGGLTTYSALATGTAALFDDSRIGIGLAYALGTVVVGAGATLLGIVLASGLHDRRAADRHEAGGADS
ncbi:CrcB family protein [Mumia sp. zg.B17]|uniref:fluoride efflux transporter FluC n=1 Tax=Mumia sp. zg.B17 TaxID=2855446 RepID=UPI001C6E7D41|nr:CrcB family protein [Mumia sp. zg.B17]MBW9204395.1 CrcB family protein [Mumia sp. zg.B17]